MKENPTRESKNTGLKLLFDRRLRLEFRGAKITTDAGLLVVRKLDEMMGLTDMVEVAVPEKLFRSMLSRIHRLGRACARAPALRQYEKRP